MNLKRLFLSFLFLFSSGSLLSFWDELFDLFAYDDDYEQQFSSLNSYDLSAHASSYTPLTAGSLLHGYSRLIRLKGVTGAKNIPGFFHHESRARVPLRHNWKCGLHMLYNMCEIERILGISDITDDEFIRECKRVPKLLDSNGSFPKDLKKAAQSIVCAPVYIVEHNERTRRIDIVHGSPNEKTFWAKINNHLDKPGVQCVHFGCLIYDEDMLDEEGNPECHIFLISAVKNINGRFGFYLLDNMNREASRSAQKQMLRHVEYIYENVLLG